MGGGGGGRGAPGDAAAPAAVLAWVYTSSPMAQLPAEVVPTEAYMMKLREGAADQYLDPTYQVRNKCGVEVAHRNPGSGVPAGVNTSVE